MALKLGELVAFIRADDDQFQRSLKQGEKAWQKHGDKLKAGAALIGAAIGVALAAGIAGAIQTDAAKAKLTAQLGGSAEYAADMGRIAGAVYARGFGESAQAVNETLRTVLSSGLLAEDASDADIEAITMKAQALATVFDQDVTQTARAAGQMIRNGLAGNASQAFDLLTRGFQQSGDHAGDLLDTVSEYSTKFRGLGLDGATALGLLQQGLKAGARDADTVADALKEFSIRAVDGSKASAAGFEALGLNAAKMTSQIARGGPEAQAGLDMVLDRLRAIKDPVERDAAAVALFGTKAEDMGAALLAMDPETAAARLGTVTGAADKMGQTLEQSGSQKLESFKRKAQSALVDKLGEAVPTLEKVAGWIERNSGFVGGLATGLGALALVIGTILGIYKVWIILQTALNIVMMLNPIGLIVLAVIGLILIFAGLWMKFEGFRNFWKATWEVIKNAAIAVWDFIVAAAKKWWETFSGFWKGVGKFFVGLWDGIVSGVKGAWKWITETFDKVVGFIGGLPKKISAKVRGMWDGIKESFRAAINWMIGKWNNFSLTIGGGSIMGINIPSVRLDTPNIPMLADGGNIMRAGTAMVGERGPELVHLGRGAQVQPLSGSSGGGLSGTLRLILQWPDGRVIRDQLIDAASLQGQSPGRYLSITPA